MPGEDTYLRREPPPCRQAKEDALKLPLHPRFPRFGTLPCPLPEPLCGRAPCDRKGDAGSARCQDLQGPLAARLRRRHKGSAFPTKVRPLKGLGLL